MRLPAGTTRHSAEPAALERVPGLVWRLHREEHLQPVRFHVFDNTITISWSVFLRLCSCISLQALDPLPDPADVGIVIRQLVGRDHDPSLMIRGFDTY